MELGSTEKFQFYLDQSFDYKEALERQKIDHNNVVNLRERIAKISHAPQIIHDKMLLIFLNGCKSDIDAAVKRLGKYYEIKSTSPELFWNRNPELEALQFAFKIQQMAPLPITPDNCYLFIHRLTDSDPQKFHFDDAFKIFMMMAENTILKNGPRDGSIFISDWTGASFGHLFRASVSSIRKGLDYIQNASPLKMKAVHVFNSSHLVQILFSMVKPFIKKELLDVIHIHPPDLDYEEFFKKHIPRHCMPADYGGELPSVETLHTRNVETLSLWKEYFYLEEQNIKHEFNKDFDYLRDRHGFIATNEL